MRLHHLTLQAFGPFPGCEQVDFDELADAGLFLLTGPTGAGKTTILDAICFALYGSVPGIRGVKALKSQHADSDTAPEVVLDFSVRERRFNIRRSPEWSRPKRRGEGTTTEHARATLVETTTGSDHLLSSRAQEVGHLVGELVGMQATQFVQVAMLPQGEFQRFLRASSQDRHEVLQHLFRTDRYTRIEEWVQDHSRELRRRADSGRQAVVRLLDTVAERAGTALPDRLAPESLAGGSAEAEAMDWVDGIVESERETLRVAVEDHRGRADRAVAARARHEAATRTASLLARRRAAEEQLAQLDAGLPVEQQAQVRLEAHARGRGALSLCTLLEESGTAEDSAEASWREAAETLDAAGIADAATGWTGAVTEVDAGQLRALEEQTTAELARLESFLPREIELVQAREARTTVDRALAEVIQGHVADARRAEELPAELARARADLELADRAADRAARLDLEVATAQDRLDAARGADECAEQLRRHRDRVRDTRDRAADARERVQDLTARRLAGMAAELAGTLVDGIACQVCGSSEHPAPATAPAEPVTTLMQQQAQELLDQALTAHTAATAEVSRAEQRLEALTAAAAGVDAAGAGEHVDRLRAALDEARAAAASAPSLAALVARLDTETGALGTRVREHAVREASLRQERSGLRDAVARLEHELAQAIGAAPTVSDGIERTRSRLEAVRAARQAAECLVAARRHRRDVSTRVAEAAEAAGFLHADELRGAVLDREEQSRLEALLAARTRDRERALGVLDDPEVRAATGLPSPDLAGLLAEVAAVEAAEAEAARTLHHSDELVTALEGLRGRLTAAWAAWIPLLQRHRTAESMACLVRGSGGDNQLQMRLSAYVLATRLDQVVSAANERLAHMRDQRYLLQRSGRVHRRGSQAGLGLEVLDQWTGEVREPTTLSGGETFVVSLALALGLADVVTQEAGGTEIETLFVDEGFGTLDADTLDDVMDRLDDLRAGGRAVGVVSHVTEMRDRIPVQLHVRKLRTGSSVAVSTMVG
jgi:exonuclease SbcC